MGAANSVRKLTIDSIALLEQLEPNATEMEHKHQVQQHVQALLMQKWPTCRVLPFGSSESGLGFGGSDLDLGIYFEDMVVDSQGQYSPQDRIDILTAACSLLSNDFEVKQFIRNARVPVLKLWDPKRQVACDVCVGGIHVVVNTALLKYYSLIDPRVRPLAFAVKYWAKQRGINDSANGTLSSYGFLLLLIFYLQSRHSGILLPPVHSIFQSLLAEKKLSTLLERLNSIPTTDLPGTFGTIDSESVGALLVGFFEFYAHQFNMEDDVVSIRTGVALSKTTKWSRPVAWRLSIEDPFELTHDVGRAIFHKKGQEIVHSEFQRAHKLANLGGRLEDICATDETSWNFTATCYMCSGTAHTTRDCDQLSHRFNQKSEGDGRGLSFLSDCWYCGETGHIKAACPMLFFRDIPHPSDKRVVRPSPLQVSTNVQPSALVYPPPSPPIAIPIPSLKKTVSPRLGKFRTWEQDISSPSPARPTKKKRRSRHASPTILPTSSLLAMKHPPSPPPFTLAPVVANMCGKKWATSASTRRETKIAVNNIVCRS